MMNNKPSKKPMRFGYFDDKIILKNSKTRDSTMNKILPISVILASTLSSSWSMAVEAPAH
jgi:hypothetical protein